MIFSMTKQEIQEDILREYKAGIERDDIIYSMPIDYYPEKALNFLESLYLRIPPKNFYFKENSNGSVTAINCNLELGILYRYLKGISIIRNTIFEDLKDKYFTELDSGLKERFLRLIIYTETLKYSKDVSKDYYDEVIKRIV